MRPHGKNQQTSSTNEELDPQEFFIDVVLLISEARFHEKNVSGRSEGPHCPDVGRIISTTKLSSSSSSQTTPLSVPANHVCDLAQFNCRQARHIVDETTNLWSRNIPACLYVFLLPDQCTNVTECLSSDAVLLERWTIQVLPKRNTDNRLLPAQFLLQAIRSYLHFSQLSAWLIESRGKSPANVTYRVSMPGESDDGQSLNINSTNEKHQFPTCLLGKSLILNVSVESLPRPFDLLSLHCRCFNNCEPSSSTTTTRTNATNANANLLVSSNESIINELSTSSNEIKDPLTTASTSILPSYFDKDQPPVATSFSSTSNVSTVSDDYYYNSPLTPSTSSSNDIDNDISAEQKLPMVSSTSYEPISLPTIKFSEDFARIRTMTAERPDDEDKTKKNVSVVGCTATNPLFESNFGGDTSLKQRIEALRLEAQHLTTKWRRYASDQSMKSYTTQNQPQSSEVRFFVPDDDEDDAESSSMMSYQNSSLYDHASTMSSFYAGVSTTNLNSYHQRYQTKASTSLSNTDEASTSSSSTSSGSKSSSSLTPTSDSRVIKCRKILFSGDELFHNSEDEPSLIDFVVQPTTDDVEASSKCNASSSTSPLERSGGAVKRKESLNDRLCRRQNESTLLARKWTKKSSTHNAAVLHFNRRTGLPLSSSPAPLKRNQNSFNFDSSLSSVTAIKHAFYNNDHESGSSDSDSGVPLCKSAPASTNLLGNFEESALNGRIKPFGSVDGFTLELGASGAFCPSHVTLPVTTLFFTVSDDNAPSPYFGHCGLEAIGRKGYHTPKKGTVQATLFNPQGTVVKMFVVRYDLSDMPVGCQTFVRQRTFFMPSSATLDDALRNRSWLRYLIHLRFATSRSGKLYLHTDIRMLFSRKSELDAYNIDYAACSTSNNIETYELRSFTEMPKNPKFSPKKLSGRQEKDKEIYV